MQLYTLFVFMAAATVLSPGLGVVMTLTNSLRSGFSGTLGGILGIAIGALVVAALSATGLGLLLATSAVAFTLMKLIGAAYLIYLGFRLWNAKVHSFDPAVPDTGGFVRRFVEGLSLQLTNPKVVFFFLSIFPQFIEPDGNYSFQFALLVLTYSALVVVIHSFYAFFARSAKTWLMSDIGGRITNKAGAVAFMFFGASLVFAKRQ